MRIGPAVAPLLPPQRADLGDETGLVGDNLHYGKLRRHGMTVRPRSVAQADRRPKHAVSENGTASGSWLAFAFSGAPAAQNAHSCVRCKQPPQANMASRTVPDLLIRPVVRAT